MIFKGTKAYDRIMEFIPDAQFESVDEMVSRMEDFYGDEFILNIDIKHKNSNYGIDSIDNSDGSSFLRARLNLKPSTRTAEALIHELLHLNMPFEGYPALSGFTSLPEKKQVKSLTLLVNVIDHKIMINDYLDLGLQQSKFMTNSLEDYSGVRDCNINWWLINYCIKYISRDCLLENDLVKVDEWLNKFTRLASKIHPNFIDTLKPIHDWSTKYTNLEHTNYFEAVNDALIAANLPTIVSYLTIQGNEVVERTV